MSGDSATGWLTGRRPIAVALAVAGLGLAGVVAWVGFLVPTGPTVAVSGEMTATDVFRGQLAISGGQNVTVRGVQVQAVGADRVLRTKRYERVDSASARNVTIRVDDGRVRKIRVRFESITGTETVTVRGLRRTDDGTLRPYTESASEYRYAVGR